MLARNAMRTAGLALLALTSCSPSSELARNAGSAVPRAAVSAGPPAAKSATGTVDCPAPDGREPPMPAGGVALVGLCEGVYAEAKATAEERDSVKRWYSESLGALPTVFGAAARVRPTAIVCKTDACALQFAGPTRRSRAFLKPRPTVIINGIGSLTKGTILHEMIHLDLAQRAPGGFPAWFDEGVATFVGDNLACPPGVKRAVDDLRRLDAYYVWDRFTNSAGTLQPAYCQARNEIAAWTGRRDRDALREVIDAVAAGRAFDDVYGPLATAIPPEDFDRSLDARFALDENAETNALDQTGRPHIASLMRGAAWTTGRRGAAVKVRSGAYVRADDFADFGLPDAPFSISLWAKPLANGKVIVHTAMNASGSDGWCVPLLGHDARGNLVAQINFANDESAFIEAVGPKLPLGTWSHLVTTWNASDGVRLYVNGTLSASAQPQSRRERHRSGPGSPAYLFFGSSNGSRCWTRSIEPGDWNGALDELRVYNYALTPDEVARDMRGP